MTKWMDGWVLQHTPWHLWHSVHALLLQKCAHSHLGQARQARANSCPGEQPPNQGQQRGWRINPSTSSLVGWDDSEAHSAQSPSGPQWEWALAALRSNLLLIQPVPAPHLTSYPSSFFPSALPSRAEYATYAQILVSSPFLGNPAQGTLLNYNSQDLRYPLSLDHWELKKKKEGSKSHVHSCQRLTQTGHSLKERDF